MPRSPHWRITHSLHCRACGFNVADEFPSSAVKRRVFLGGCAACGLSTLAGHAWAQNPGAHRRSLSSPILPVMKAVCGPYRNAKKCACAAVPLHFVIHNSCAMYRILLAVWRVTTARAYGYTWFIHGQRFTGCVRRALIWIRHWPTIRQPWRRAAEPPQVHRGAGFIYRTRQQTNEAKASFQRYLELAPDVLMIKSYSVSYCFY